jgi:putative ATP-dependent endonuclease of OLD family
VIKKTSEQQSPNELNLTNYGLTNGVDFLVSKKRLLENYIHPSAIQRLVPAATFHSL